MGKALGDRPCDHLEGLAQPSTDSRRKPRQIRRFGELWGDPRLVEKLHERRTRWSVYMNPPDNGRGLLLPTMKSQIQALDRTQPSLPLIEGSSRHHDTRLQAAPARPASSRP